MKYKRIWWSWDEVKPFKSIRPSLDEIRATIAKRDKLILSEGGNMLWQGKFPEYLMEFLRDWCVLPNRGLFAMMCMSLNDIKEEYKCWTYGQ